eukprot:11056323-Alexandrium_andersonii.AAC.1
MAIEARGVDSPAKAPSGRAEREGLQPSNYAQTRARARPPDRRAQDSRAATAPGHAWTKPSGPASARCSTRGPPREL